VFQTESPQQTQGQPNADAAAPSDTTAAPEGAVDSQAPTAPEGLPETYWTEGKINVDAIKALHEKATAFETAQAEREAQLPKDGAYTIALPDDLKDEAGQPIQIDQEAPAYKVLIDAAKELKLTPAETNKFAEQMVRLEYAEAKAEAEAKSKRLAEESAKLGANPKARIEAVRNGFVAQIGEDAADLLSNITTAKGVIAAEKLLAKLTGASITPNPLPNANGGNRPTAAQVLYPNTPRS
jgi:flagellar biosynthesis/type III secretory pathway protein FliH